MRAAVGRIFRLFDSRQFERFNIKRRDPTGMDAIKCDYVKAISVTPHSVLTFHMFEKGVKGHV